MMDIKTRINYPHFSLFPNGSDRSDYFSRIFFSFRDFNSIEQRGRGFCQTYPRTRDYNYIYYKIMYVLYAAKFHFVIRCIVEHYNRIARNLRNRKREIYGALTIIARKLRRNSEKFTISGKKREIYDNPSDFSSKNAVSCTGNPVFRHIVLVYCGCNSEKFTISSDRIARNLR